MTKRHFKFLAAEFRAVYLDPTTHDSTVYKMVNAFCAIAKLENKLFDESKFRAAVYGGSDDR